MHGSSGKLCLIGKNLRGQSLGHPRLPKSRSQVKQEERPEPRGPVEHLDRHANSAFRKSTGNGKFNWALALNAGQDEHTALFKACVGLQIIETTTPPVPSGKTSTPNSEDSPCQAVRHAPLGRRWDGVASSGILAVFIYCHHFPNATSLFSVDTTHACVMDGLRLTSDGRSRRSDRESCPVFP
jgi:hypothetical protein